MESWSEGSHKDTYNYRSACNAELYRGADSRKHDRDASEDESQDDAHEDGQKVGIGKSLRFVAEDGAYILDCPGLTYDCELVSQLQAKVPRREEVDAGPVYACDVDAVGVSQTHVAKLHSVMFGLGHEHLGGNKLAVDGVPVDVLLVPVGLFLLSEEELDLFNVLFSGDHQNMLVFLEDCFRRRDDQPFILPYP